MPETSEVKNKQDKSTYTEIKELVSSLYRHFLIFDLTYIVSGMVVLLTILFANWAIDGKNSYDIAGFFSSLKEFTKDRRDIIVLFIVFSYFTGLICYDFFDNITVWLFKLLSKDAIEWKNYELTIRDHTKEREDNSWITEVLITKYERIHHFEVVSVSFAAAFLVSGIVVAFTGQWQIAFYYALIMLICVYNCIGVILYKLEFTQMDVLKTTTDRTNPNSQRKLTAHKQYLLMLAGIAMLCVLPLLSWYLFSYCPPKSPCPCVCTKPAESPKKQPQNSIDFSNTLIDQRKE